MKRYIFISLLAIGLVSNTKADQAINVSIDIKNSSEASLEITYPVTSGPTSLEVLGSNEKGTALNEGIKLVSAKSQSGEARTTNDAGEGHDAYIDVKSGDTSITVSYELKNCINSDQVGLFNFPLIFGNTYVSNVDVSVIIDENTGFIFPTALDASGTFSGRSFHLQADGKADGYTHRDLMFWTYRKDSYAAYSKRQVGKYVLLAPNNKIDQFEKAVSDLTSADSVFKEIFGFSDPGSTFLMIFPFSKQRLLNTGNEVGLALESQHSALFDTQAFSYQKSSTFAKGIIVHELTHLLLGSQQGPFSDNRSIRWVDESLAVFASQYIADKLDFSKSDQADLPFADRKFTIDELKNVYANHQFDIDFKIDTKDHLMAETYTQGGLIFYNIFLKNPDFVKSIISGLKSGVYNKDSALNKIKSITGMSENDVIYPYKGNLGSIDKRLILSPAASSTQVSNSEQEQKERSVEKEQESTVKIATTADKKIDLETNGDSNNQKENTIPYLDTWQKFWQFVKDLFHMQ